MNPDCEGHGPGHTVNGKAWIDTYYWSEYCLIQRSLENLPPKTDLQLLYLLNLLFSKPEKQLPCEVRNGCGIIARVMMQWKNPDLGRKLGAIPLLQFITQRYVKFPVPQFLQL